MSYACWVLDEAQRSELLERFVPVFPDVIAHHITLKNPSRTVPEPAVIHIVGRIIDETGVDALVVSVAHGTEEASIRRADGNFYHITWSIDRAAGKKPFSSVEACSRLLLSDSHEVLDAIEVRTSPAVEG